MKCSKCKNDLAPELFAFRNRKKNIRHKQCKQCQSIAKREHYELHKSDYLERAKAKNKETSEKIAAFIEEAKSVPCADCGNSFHHCVMDFDHIRGRKLGNVSHLKKIHSMRKVQEEIVKCEVVCANCHRIRTYNRIHGETKRQAD